MNNYIKNNSVIFPEEHIEYNIDGRSFIVTPMFCTNGKETLYDILFKLIKSEKPGV